MRVNSDLFAHMQSDFFMTNEQSKLNENKFLNPPWVAFRASVEPDILQSAGCLNVHIEFNAASTVHHS